MGQKKMIDTVDEQRNNLGLKSLGDKIYKYPEYASRFYHERGLIPGSSNTFKETKKTIRKTLAEQTNNKSTGMKWKDRVKLEEKAEEEKAVLSLFDWEKTTLKEANPKWRDPDAVEAEVINTKVVDQKNVKKAPPKK